jgi:hypothetical protein
MNSQEAVLCRAKREIFGRWDPEPARGEEAGEISNAASLGVNALPPPRWPMGKKTGRTLRRKRSTVSAPAERFDDHALRHESRFPRPPWKNWYAREIPVFRIAWGELCSPTRSGQTFLSKSCGRITSTDEKKVIILSSLSQDRTTKRSGLRPARCHAALLVLSRPLRAALAVAYGQPGQRSTARQTPHIPFFFQNNGDFSDEA